MPDELDLFDMEAPEVQIAASLQMITAAQRTAIRDAFAELGVTHASEQLDIVYELTALRIRNPEELEARHAQVCLIGLRNRIRTRAASRTGNAWNDREEDTWIDKL
jgi:hypothetical protein